MAVEGGQRAPDFELQGEFDPEKFGFRTYKLSAALEESPVRERDGPPALPHARHTRVAHAQHQIGSVHAHVAPALQRPAGVERGHPARREPQSQIDDARTAYRKVAHDRPVHCRLTGQSIVSGRSDAGRRGTA